MKPIKNKMYSSLISGLIFTTLGLFAFIQHWDKTVSHFLLYVGLFNYLILAVMIALYYKKARNGNAL
jgi:hypothetical protein